MLVLAQQFGFYMVYTVVLNASYEVRSCLLLNDFMLSCRFHVFLNNLFLPRVDNISNVEPTLSVAWMAPLKEYINLLWT